MKFQEKKCLVKFYETKSVIVVFGTCQKYAIQGERSQRDIGTVRHLARKVRRPAAS
jgi:hypothetical protein